ncbi:MAG: hypothetical protein ACLR06_08290 [Christensenellaceae bacterium]
MKKEDTPSRIIQRRYEATRKEWRKETTAQFNTRLPRKEFEEIETFLKERHLRKLDLIYEGYFSYLKNLDYCRKTKRKIQKNKSNISVADREITYN